MTSATVALMTPNCVGFTVASMGVVKAGCKLTNVNPLYTEPELEHQLLGAAFADSGETMKLPRHDYVGRLQAARLDRAPEVGDRVIHRGVPPSE